MHFTFLFAMLLLPCSLFASNVLVVGDSQTVGPYGQELDRLLRADGNKVETHGACGSTARWWFTGQDLSCGYFGKDLNGNIVPSSGSTPIITGLLEKNKPEYVIMQFSGNYRGWSASAIQADLQKMIDAVKNSGAKCMYVTGPNSNYKRQEHIEAVEIIKKAVGTQCEFFDSTEVTTPPANGSAHYGTSTDIINAKKWAQLVRDRFVSILPDSAKVKLDTKIVRPAGGGSRSQKTLIAPTAGGGSRSQKTY